MRSILVAFFSISLFASAHAQESQQLPAGMKAVPEVTTPGGVGTDCLSLTNVGDVLTCIAREHAVIVPLHFYTGEYTAFPEADFGPRYDPRNYNGYGPIAADMCKRYAPQIASPAINYTEYKSISGGC